MNKILNHNKPGTFAAALALIFSAPVAMAQTDDTFGYQATNVVPYSYLNIANSGVSVLSGSDDANATVNLGFAFRFYGNTYTSVCVSTNGLITFGSCAAGDATNLDLTSQSPQGNPPLAAAFWDDLTFNWPGAGAVVYQTIGEAGVRQFIVQWNNVFVLNTNGALNFQVILYEGSNNLLFQYQRVEAGAADFDFGKSATVGIRNANGQSNGQRLQWSYNAAVLKNNMAIRITAPAATAAVDVTAKVSITPSAFVQNRVTKVYTGTITVTNTSTTPLPRPLTLLLTQLPDGVSLVGPTGLLPGQGPYVTLPGDSATPLAPGQSVILNVSFNNTGTSKIVFVGKAYSGIF